MIQAAVASYSLMTGIQIVYSWELPKNHNGSNQYDIKTNDQLQQNATNPTLNFFRTILMNAFQHDEQYFKTFPTTEVNDRNSNLKVVASLFKPNAAQKKPQTICAFAFFIDQKYQNINTVMSDLVKDYAVECATLIQNAMRKNSPLYSIDNDINSRAEQISFIFNAGVESIHSISSVVESTSTQEQNFYASVLWCHLYTQMTTILELDENQTGDDVPLFSFLASFMLPFQLQLSDSKPHDSPIPGFFLQCVKPQKGLPKETLLMFKRPWTWVRVGLKQLCCIGNISVHKDLAKQYIQTIRLNYDLQPNDLKDRIIKSEKDIIKQNGFMTVWSNSKISLLSKFPDHLRVTFAREILNELVQKAVILIQAINLLIKPKKQPSFIYTNQLKEICTTFDISDDDKDIILSIANLFDSSIFNRIYNYKTQFYKKMVVSS
ncbi:hypothetical protein M9Y10_020068 [Tritrichomonas musculus]|uniref:Uncharacterized protein n=1 Tax=Tritrichomonas musculus TaxID=1915356 RepID=A0ABR2HF49_9EUKA